MAGAADAVNSALASIDVEDPFAAVHVPPVDISGAMSSVPDFSPGDAEAAEALQAGAQGVACLLYTSDGCRRRG